MAEGLGADACARSPSLSGSWASLPRPHPRPRDLPSPWGLATPHPLGGASDPQSAAATAETQAVRIQARPWVSAEAGSAGRGHPCAASSDRKDTRGGVELTTGPGEEAEGPLRGPPSLHLGVHLKALLSPAERPPASPAGPMAWVGWQKPPPTVGPRFRACAGRAPALRRAPGCSLCPRRPRIPPRTPHAVCCHAPSGSSGPWQLLGPLVSTAWPF